MNSFTITVTEAHLQKAIEAAKAKRDVSICQRCVVAQALNEVSGLELLHMGFAHARTSKGTFHCAEAERITALGSTWDVLNASGKISALLPLTLTFTRRN